jgi:hypothetical protein
MNLEDNRDPNASMRQHVDQRISRESVCPVLCEMADSRLTHAEPARRLHLRQPSRTPHFTQLRHQNDLDSAAGAFS